MAAEIADLGPGPLRRVHVAVPAGLPPLPRHRAAMISAPSCSHHHARRDPRALDRPLRRDRAVGDPRTETIGFLPPSPSTGSAPTPSAGTCTPCILYGGRVSLFIGVAVALSSAIIGTLVGAFAGYRAASSTTS